MKFNRFHKQSGASLMEVLVAMTISLVVTASMIAMMSNTLGTTARIINMTKLQDDMRVAMQMMTRDVRRSNFNAASQYCYANNDCGTDIVTFNDVDGVAIELADDIGFNDTNTCFFFAMDREGTAVSTGDELGGFRQVPKTNERGIEVGVIQMWTGGADDVLACGEDPETPGSKWVDITNPESMDIFAFTVDDDLSYEETILDNGTDTVTQRIRKLRMDMQGQLVLDNSVQRHIVDVIDVRNDLLL